MKKIFISIFAAAYALILAGCNYVPDSTREVVSDSDLAESAFSQEAPDRTQESASTPNAESDAAELPEYLPAALATVGDIDGSGGYLLIGEIPEADIALYCDNLENRTMAYIRYGEHFQAFYQEAWTDPTVLPELDWRDWDNDGTKELMVKYLRHEGTFFDGETTSPGLVYEMVVYKWDNEQWTDIHFYSSGPLQT